MKLLPAAFLIAMIFSSSPLPAQLTSEAISAARKYSAAHHGIGMIVKERGQIRYEDYYNGYSGDPLHIYSGTKSFFGILAIAAMEDGLLDLDEPAAKTLTEWQDDPRKSRITIRDLLNFTSGLETGFEEIYGRGSEDKVALAVGLDATRDRGASFVYGPSHLNAFCEILRRKLKRKGLSYAQYLNRKVTGPLGVNISRWREDNQGNPVPSAGMYMTGKEWMKLGELVLGGGVYEGRRIVKTENLVECFRGTEINPAFGLCFWLNGHADDPGAREVDVEEDLELEPMPEDWRGACLSKNAPPELICSLGSTFQRLYIVPSMDLIVVHHGKSGRTFRDYEFLKILFEGAGVPQSPETSEPEKRPFKPLFPKLFKRPE